MKEIEFGYAEFPRPGDKLRPTANIYIINGKKSIHQPCLIDTGADNCTFPLDFLPLVGIDIKRVRKNKNKEPFSCACGNKSTGYYYSIKIQIVGYDKPIKVKALWTEFNSPPLLGREGVFDFFNVEFKKDKIVFRPRRSK